MDFIVPKTDVILLTDSQHTAAVLATPESPFGTMLSRGAVRVLHQQWFGPAAAPVTEPTAREWARSLSGVTIASSKPKLGKLIVTETKKNETLALQGFREFKVGAGKLTNRTIGPITVRIHEVGTPLSNMPVIDRPLSISADIATAPPELMLQRVGGFAGNKCAGCAGCATCAGCVFCAEVNFYVGAVGLAGLVGFIGLAAAVPGPAGSLGIS